MTVLWDSCAMFGFNLPREYKKKTCDAIAIEVDGINWEKYC